MVDVKQWIILVASLLAVSGPTRATVPLLYNPAMINIGFVCQWQAQCMKQQGKAMQRSLKFVAKQRPPAWKIHLCNRNASRRHTRVDWVGYDHCIRNSALGLRNRARR